MKIAFLDIVHASLQEGLEQNDFDCVDLTKLPKKEVERIIHEFDGIVIRSRFPMDEEFLSKATNLKFIARSGAGMENIDIPYCEKRGIQLFSAPEGNRNAVAEHALGMLLCLFNNIHLADKEVKSGNWYRESNRGVELDGKTVGIIGYGNNGSAFAKKLLGFDVEVLVYDKYKSGFGNNHVQEVGLSELTQRADVLSLHIPQNEETIGWIDSEFISKMNKPIYLINLSRGKIVKTNDLLTAIEQNKVLGACLDVLEYEKSSFEDMFNGEEVSGGLMRLIQSDKVLLTPHVGGWTRESYQKLSEVLLDKILTHFG
ncbi:MAG: phosphoglycerate dehydrogenase [Crocinitomicaceae bacterium]|nr:phosphoglycerate dehydrogenase [Crocinitomicaceae bacterium]